MTTLVLLALYVIAVECESETQNNFPDEAAQQNETGLLVNHLRKRLMKDNYDYQTNDTEESPSHRQHNDDDDDGAQVDRDDNLGSEAVPNDDKHDIHVNNLFVPRAHNADKIEGSSHVVSKKDLLFYVDDESLNRMAANKVIEKTYTESTNAPSKLTTRKVKYKLYKMRNKQPNRRSGKKRAYHRFVQEKREDGIALIPLDEAPLPEIRLPPNRRQYMHGHDHFNDDENTDLSDTIPDAKK